MCCKGLHGFSHFENFRRGGEEEGRSRVKEDVRRERKEEKRSGGRFGEKWRARTARQENDEGDCEVAQA